MENERQKNKYDVVQVIRAIACLFVVLCHTDFTDFGQTGVDFFFVISGFLMMVSTEKNKEHFWRRRLKRIVPLYWGMTIWTSVLICIAPSLFRSYEYSTEYLIKSLCFIPYYHNGISGPIMALGWTLNYEMFFYVLFWICMKINDYYRHILVVFLSVFFVVCGMNFDLPVVIEYWSNPIILEFSYGVLIYVCLNGKLKKENAHEDKKNILLTVWCYVLLILGVVLMEKINQIDWIPRALGVGAIAGFLVLICLYLGNKIKTPQFLVHIGDISYSIYLFHIFIVRGVEYVVGDLFGINIFLGTIICIILSVVGTDVIVVCGKIIREKMSESRGHDFVKQKNSQ